MTIERDNTARSVLQRAVRSVLVLVALIVAWFGAMASVMLFTEAAPAALAIVPDMRMISSIGPDTKLLRGGKHVLLLTSDEPGYVGRLYGAGAWLVLPALRNGCLDYRTYERVVLRQEQN